MEEYILMTMENKLITLLILDMMRLTLICIRRK